jgi:hypothetical protein
LTVWELARPGAEFSAGGELAVTPNMGIQPRKHLATEARPPLWREMAVTAPNRASAYPDPLLVGAKNSQVRSERLHFSNPSDITSVRQLESVGEAGQPLVPIYVAEWKEPAARDGRRP